MTHDKEEVALTIQKIQYADPEAAPEWDSTMKVAFVHHTKPLVFVAPGKFCSHVVSEV